MNSVPSHQITVWMAGDIGTAYRVCREHCYAHGSCFTVTPTKFIYTGGEEDGFSVGLVNYPKFPLEPSEQWAQAKSLAHKLMPACNQRTCLLVGASETERLVIEPPGAR